MFDSFNAAVAKALPEYTSRSPFAGLVGIEVVEARPGGITCRLPVVEKTGSGVGAVHGGALLSLVDHALSLAVYPLVEIGKWCATLELKMNYLAPVPVDAGGFLVADAQVLTLRKRIAVVRVDVRHAPGAAAGADRGELVATAQGTVYVRERSLPR